MIDLGEAEPIDQLIRDFRQRAAEPVDLLGMTRKNQSKTDKNTALQTGIKLRRALVDPLREAVGAYKHWLVAPDGSINLLPLQLLPLEETGQKLLLDEHTISYLSVGRDILRRQVQTKRPAVEPLILADPDFDLGELAAEEVRPPGTHPQSGKVTQAVPMAEQLLNTLAGEHFERVKSTRLLAQRVAQKLGVRPYLEAEALESCLTSGSCPSLLLIATHGHFSELEEPERNFLDALLACPKGQEQQVVESYQGLLDRDSLELVKVLGARLEENGYPDRSQKMQVAAELIGEILNSPRSTPLQTDRLAAVRVKNPMMRSGLALAGANTWLAGGKLPPKAGKGFLFALDVAQLDLWANELTVLLACQSGVGEIEMGEGVSGLRRAFAVAGAKTLVMSLWEVPQRASVLLMERFFDNLQTGQGRASALQSAQNYVRTISVKELQHSPLGREVLKELKTRHPQVSCLERLEFQPLQHPFYWGAWICQGETQALPYQPFNQA